MAADTCTALRPPAGEGAPAAGASSADLGRYLTFAVGGEVYALGILDVTEIIAFRSLTTVPMMPDFVRGVINLRGRVVPVVDLAGRFGTGSTAVHRRTSVVIIDVPARPEGSPDETGLTIGLMVDAVNEVVTFAETDLEPPPPFGAAIRAEFIRGMARRDGRFIVVLDIERVLCVDDLIAFGRAVAQQSETAARPGRAVGESGPADH
jgi:purine-binding chemotaxis protein CheW